MKGIMFRPEMAVAVRNGSKTVTRRIIKPQPNHFHYTSDAQYPCKPDGEQINPKYQVGEVVYIKEAWAVSFAWEGTKPRDMPPSIRLYFKDSDIDIPLGKWRSPMFLKAINARSFIKILDAIPEQLNIKTMSTKEVELEGGESAIKYLMSCDGKWMWRYSFQLLDKLTQ